MTQVILEAGMRSKLRDLREALEICDEKGTILARLTPVLDPSQYQRVEPPISPQELQRRRSEPDFSTAEVLAHLEKL